MGILRQLAAGGATTVMHGLVGEEELRNKAAAVSKEYGTTVGTSTANLLKPEEIRWAWQGETGQHGDPGGVLAAAAAKSMWRAAQVGRRACMPIASNLGLPRPPCLAAGTWWRGCRTNTASWTSW